MRRTRRLKVLRRKWRLVQEQVLVGGAAQRPRPQRCRRHTPEETGWACHRKASSFVRTTSCFQEPSRRRHRSRMLPRSYRELDRSGSGADSNASKSYADASVSDACSERTRLSCVTEDTWLRSRDGRHHSLRRVRFSAVCGRGCRRSASRIVRLEACACRGARWSHRRHRSVSVLRRARVARKAACRSREYAWSELIRGDR